MNLTKEECIEYLETLKNFACLNATCCMQTLEEKIEDKKLYDECINYFEQLINEYFTLVEEYKSCRQELEGFYGEMCNPPLKFNDLKNMIGKPVYHNILKRNFIIENVEVGEYREKKIKVRDYIVDYLIYMEDCFYAREVKE